jgi:hypothetical protein
MVVAGLRGASRWAVVLLVAAMLVLLFVGLIEGASVLPSIESKVSSSAVRCGCDGTLRPPVAICEC